MPPKNDGIVLPLRLQLVAPPLHSPLRRGRLFWVGCCVLISNRRPSTPRAQPISLYFSSLASIRRPKQWDNNPHTFRPGRVSSLTPPSPLTTTFGWLLCPPIKRRPSNAKGPPISLFFGRLIRPPKRRAASSPHVLTQPHLFSNAPSNVVTVSHLIVV